LTDFKYFSLTVQNIASDTWSLHNRVFFPQSGSPSFPRNKSYGQACGILSATLSATRGLRNPRTEVWRRRLTWKQVEPSPEAAVWVKRRSHELEQSKIGSCPVSASGPGDTHGGGWNVAAQLCVARCVFDGSQNRNQRFDRCSAGKGILFGLVVNGPCISTM